MMLCVDQSKRWTAAQLLQHPWITLGDDKLANKDLSSSITVMRKFNARRRLKSAADAVIMANRMKNMMASLGEFLLFCWYIFVFQCAITQGSTYTHFVPLPCPFLFYIFGYVFFLLQHNFLLILLSNNQAYGKRKPVKPRRRKHWKRKYPYWILMHWRA